MVISLHQQSTTWVDLAEPRYNTDMTTYLLKVRQTSMNPILGLVDTYTCFSELGGIVGRVKGAITCYRTDTMITLRGDQYIWCIVDGTFHSSVEEDLSNACDARDLAWTACFKYDAFIECGFGGEDPDEASRLLAIATRRMEFEVIALNKLSPFHRHFYRCALG